MTWGIDPLTPFLMGYADPPYDTRDFPEGGRYRGSEFRRHAQVVQVPCESGLARSRKTSTRYVHRAAAMAAVIEGDRMRLAARWLCSAQGSPIAVIVADAAGMDMCPRCDDRKAGPAVYRLISDRGDLLYVGASAELASRLRDHALTKHWWPQVADIRVERFSDMASAYAAEVRAILAENPLHNQKAWGRKVYASYPETGAAA